MLGEVQGVHAEEQGEGMDLEAGRATSGLNASRNQGRGNETNSNIKKLIHQALEERHSHKDSP